MRSTSRSVSAYPKCSNFWARRWLRERCGWSFGHSRSGLRFTERENLQDWTRIGAMNGEVGRVTPCATSFALRESVIASVGAQRTARPTSMFMEYLFHPTR